MHGAATTPPAHVMMLNGLLLPLIMTAGPLWVWIIRPAMPRVAHAVREGCRFVRWVINPDAGRWS